ncbi:MAG: hypothetical protein ACEPOZ_02865 [Marinifilaceae bacterium]
MKKLLFVLAISGLVFTSCVNSTKKSAKAEETHQHEGCSHDHGDSHSHSHGDATHDHNSQEEFVVEENGSTTTCCSGEKEGECKDEKKCDHNHDGHDHNHDSHEGHSH